MATMDILYLGIVGVGTYLVWQAGLLDQAGQAIVQATAKKQQQAWGKHKKHKKHQEGWAKHKRQEILVPEIIVPKHKKRIRLTIA